MRLKSIFTLVVLCLIAATAGCNTGKAVQKNGADTGVQAPSSVARIAENYIAKYFAPEGEEVRVTSIWEEHGVYGFNVTVMGMNYTSYITRDGKIIFPTGFYTDRAPPVPEAVPPEEPTPPEEAGPSE
jgi:hypothetical protein